MYLLEDTADDSGRPREECGVFAIYGHEDAARVTFFGLFALQHRGQESAGIVTSNGCQVSEHKGMGLASAVFKESTLQKLQGSLAIGHVRYSTTGSNVPENVQRVGLGNHPNPFNPRTKISYSISQAGPVKVSVYNVRGQRVAVLVDEVKPAGEHSVVWDGKDDNGRSMASGLYFCRMEAGGKSLNQKMTLLK